MSKPLVSIICPTYNHESFIREALDGFVMQKTNFPFEIIVHDDASTDSTAQIVKEYEVEYPHLFNNIYQTVNQFSIEVMSVTKILLNAASGKYIACCEGDDYWTDPHKLQKQVDLIDVNINCGLIYSDYQKRIENELIKSQKIGCSFLNLNEYFDAGLPFIFTGSWLFRNEISDLKFFSKKFGNLPGDVQIICHVLSKGYSVKFINSEMGVYRILEESFSHSKIYDKDKGFALVKWLLVNKYKSNLYKEMYHSVINELIRKKFQYFNSFKIDIYNKLIFFSKVYKLKGINRALNFLFFNVTK